jgi:hypothetical protein
MTRIFPMKMKRKNAPPMKMKRKNAPPMKMKRKNAPPEVGDPYAEGADAALAGASESKNPYPVTSDEHLSWNDGWLSIANEAAD